VLTFSSPDEAVTALARAAKGGDVDAIVRIFGPVTAFEQKSAIEMQGNDKAVLSVGDDGFPFPFPLLHKAGRWSFDAEAGKEELLNRWIGKDHLNTIETLRAALVIGQGRVPEYAQRWGSGANDPAARRADP